jgi:hypothetical protein
MTEKVMLLKFPLKQSFGRKAPTNQRKNKITKTGQKYCNNHKRARDPIKNFNLKIEKKYLYVAFYRKNI